MEFINEIKMEMRPKIRYWLPCAAVDEQDLREEISQIYQRGFGGIEVVTLASVPEQIARGEDGWGRENWQKTVDTIADETSKHGMSMDIAIGPGWPIVATNIKDVQDEAAAIELTYGEVTVPAGTHFEGTLPERRVVHDEGAPELIAVMAYEEVQEKVLRMESYIDLRQNLTQSGNEVTLCCDLPKNRSGMWKIFAFYQQPTAQKINAKQSYVIDHLSTNGVRACEKYWEKVWEKNNYTSQESIFCDSLEYETAFDWSHGFAEEFERRRGYSILPYLPVIGLDNLYPSGDFPGYRFDHSICSDQINHDYLEVQTQMYCENHLQELECMAEKHGKTIRYQVAYNKPFEVERSALYVAVPENEALGRPTIDSMKTMAAAVHLGRKTRYSFECAAEFGNAYGQNYEDLFWWVKRSLMAGMNAQVLHGASYSGKYQGKYAENGNVPGAVWPGYAGFYGFISNDWNRTLSVQDAKGCMDAIARLNTVFRKKAKIDLIILKNTYSNDGLGSEFYLYPDGGLLAKMGYSYEFISDSLLSLSVCQVKNKRLDEDGPAYKCFIIDEEKYVSEDLLLQVQRLVESDFPVIWIGEKPISARFYSEINSEDKQHRWKYLMEKVWAMNGVIHVNSREEVPQALEQAGVMPEVKLDGKKNLMTAVHEDEKSRYIAIYAYNCIQYMPETRNPNEFGVSALFGNTNKSAYQRPGKASRETVTAEVMGGGTVWFCNPWSGKKEYIGSAIGKEGQNLQITFDMEEDELVLLEISKDERQKEEINRKANPEENKMVISRTARSRAVGKVVFDSLQLESFEPDSEDEVSFLRSGYRKYGDTFDLSDLKPWGELDARWKKIAGRGIYHGIIDLKKETGKRYFLSLGEVCDTFRVWVNGEETDFPDQVLKEVEVTEQLKNGTNELQVIVTGNLYNRLLKDGINWKNIAIPYVEKNYGITQTEGKQVCLYVTG